MNKLIVIAVIFYLAVSLPAQASLKYTVIINGQSIVLAPRLCENEDRELLKSNKFHNLVDKHNEADFPVITWKNAVEKGEMVLLNASSATEVSARTKSIPLSDLNKKVFESQFSTIVTDFQNGFKNIKGDLIPQRKGSVVYSNDYQSTIVLTGSDKTYVSISTSGNNNPTMISTFGDFDDKTTAIVKYGEIVGLIGNMVFTCCKFEKTEESVTEMFITQYFIPSESVKNTAPEYDYIVIQADVIKTLGLDSKSNLIDQWSVVLKVYSRE